LDEQVQDSQRREDDQGALDDKSFKELAAQTGSEVRSNQLEQPRGGGALLRMLKIYDNFSEILEDALHAEARFRHEGRVMDGTSS
jgi:hypothetical protein